MVDLGFFIAILCVFLVAYGVASQAILYPNATSFQEVITGVFFKAYFQMYGELFLEEIQGGFSFLKTLLLLVPFFIQVDAPFETIRYCGFEW